MVFPLKKEMQNKVIQNTKDIYPPDDLIKPAIIESFDDCQVFRAGMNYRHALKKLQKGRGMIVEGSYPTAIAFYTWLKKRIKTKNPVTDYLSSRKTKNIIHKTTKKVLLRIKEHRTDLFKSPVNPFLKALYPDKTEFLISLPDLLGINGAWQWYKNGVRYSVLEQNLHPFYGVYFPMRTEHLVMFDQWMEKNKQRFKSAVDIGTGCGVLSFIMAKHGIGSIRATDINPNAVYSTVAEVDRLGLTHCIHVEHGSFFGSQKKALELVVFNPPWIPGRCYNEIDRGIYYDDHFFNDFFDQAETRLASGSILAVIFSSFAREAGLTDHNPVEKAISNRKNIIPEEKLTSKIDEKAGHHSNTWINEIRAKEKIELWILKKI